MAAVDIIGHRDMDAFFAAVEERDHPEWRGLPIACPSGQFLPSPFSQIFLRL
jgi:nucleotidyltransferase/DNA polymerase involved in DNA repair